MSGPRALNWTFYLYRQLLSGLLRISTIITDDADKILDNHNGDLNIFHKFYFNRHAILIHASTFKFNNSCFGPFLSTEINSPVSYTTHYTRHHGCQLHSNTKYNIAHISHEMYFVIGCRQYRIFLLASCVTYEAWQRCPAYAVIDNLSFQTYCVVCRYGLDCGYAAWLVCPPRLPPLSPLASRICLSCFYLPHHRQLYRHV